MRTQNLVNGVETASEVFCRAVIEQAHNAEGLPFILNYAPLAQVNPFQQLLYCRAEAAGYATVPAVTFDDLAPVPWRGRGVIHLHWLASILSGIESTVNADEKSRISNEVFADGKNGATKLSGQCTTCYHTTVF